jgi:TRAP-type C4-dicarboxylate transport system substrate-binding protein
MNLRRTLVAAAVALGALGTAVTAVAQTMKAADVHPPGYPTVVAVENMGKKLEAATNGRIKFQMFPGSVLGDENQRAAHLARPRRPGRARGQRLQHALRLP